MKKMSYVLSLTLFSCCLTAALNAQTTSKITSSTQNSKKQVVVPVRPDIPGYPVYIDTGNPSADQAEYTRRKKEWIAANPKQANEMNKAPNPSSVNSAEKERRSLIK